MNVPDHWRWRQDLLEPDECAIFDLDGVLADANARQHFLAGHRRDWDGFFGAVDADDLFEDAAALLGVVGRTMQTVVLTARPLYIRDNTIAWLDRGGVEWDLLVMRPDRDRRPSVDYKLEALHDLRKTGFDPVIAFEDDRRNLDMFRAEGVPCVYIHSGYYD